MPLYEFQCSECDRSFEELVRAATAVAEVKCPKCGSDHVRRKVSTFASKVSGGGGAVAPASACAPSGT
jgi:putative FmdB family regulatory protein